MELTLEKTKDSDHSYFPMWYSPVPEMIWEVHRVFAVSEDTTWKRTKAQQPVPRAGVKVLGFRGSYDATPLLSQCLWMRSDKPLGKGETSWKHQPFFADSRLKGMLWFSWTHAALSALLKDCCVPSLFSCLLGVVEPVSRELPHWVIFLTTNLPSLCICICFHLFCLLMKTSPGDTDHCW